MGLPGRGGQGEVGRGQREAEVWRGPLFSLPLTQHHWDKLGRRLLLCWWMEPAVEGIGERKCYRPEGWSPVLRGFNPSCRGQPGAREPQGRQQMSKCRSKELKSLVETWAQ